MADGDDVYREKSYVVRTDEASCMVSEVDD